MSYDERDKLCPPLQPLDPYAAEKGLAKRVAHHLRGILAQLPDTPTGTPCHDWAADDDPHLAAMVRRYRDPWFAARFGEDAARVAAVRIAAARESGAAHVLTLLPDPWRSLVRQRINHTLHTLHTLHPTAHAEPA